jgi:type IV secretion system protein VirB10
MRLAMRLPPKKGAGEAGSGENGSGEAGNSNIGSGEASNAASIDSDPRDSESAEVIDLASRTAYPSVTTKSTKSDTLGLLAGGAFVIGLGALALWSMNAARTTEPVAPAPEAGPPAQAAATTNEPVKEPVVKKAAPKPSNTPITPRAAAPAPRPVYSRAPVANPAAAANPYSTPTMVFDASTGVRGTAVQPVVGATPVVATPAPRAGNTNASGAGGSAAAFAGRIGGVGGAAAAAQPMTNPSTTVTQGTLIPAVLETAIDTDVPGFVRAVVSQDVRSFDGKNVLVPRSSRLVGQYQSGVQGGQKRAYVIWTRLIRPDGASVNIASPGVGFDGTTGLPGEVDNHFFRRFGSAMLLSVVGSLGAIATGGASVVLGGAGQSAASVAAQQDSQIGPTIRVRQGEPIRVFTARDLDFSGV